MLGAAVEGVFNLAKKRHYAAQAQAQAQHPAQQQVPPGYMVVDDNGGPRRPSPEVQTQMLQGAETEEYERKKKMLIGAGISLLVFGGAAFSIWRLWPRITGKAKEA